MTIVPIDATRHAGLTLGPRPDVAHGAAQNHAVLGFGEIATAAADYPLCLMKDGNTGQFNVVALFGFERDRNLYVINGNWMATWVPGTVLRYPFYRDENAPHGVAIDMASTLVGAKNGMPLFDGGAPAPLLQDAAPAIDRLIADIAAMQRFVSALVGADLIRPLGILLTLEDGKEHQIDGLYSISPTAIEALADDAVLALHRRGYLAPLYVVAASLAQLDRLRQLYDHQAASPTATLQYRVRD